MLTLDQEKLLRLKLPVGTSWLLAECMEARGKQDLWLQQKPDALQILREQAMIQSVESSNRIEGVTIAAQRLRPVVLGKSKPRDRSEEEIAGYRKALNWIFSKGLKASVTPEIIKHLHALAQGGMSGDAGQWKSRDNQIIEILTNGERKIRFVPTAAKDTPKTIVKLCDSYQSSIDNGKLPPLLLAAIFIFDFLCIHPFRDGNGRVSRLLTTLLLQSLGFQVARYISLERLTEENKEDYYQVLVQCSRNWHEEKNEIIPWCNYFFSVLRQGYKELEKQVEFIPSHGAKSELVRQVILGQPIPFTLAELAAQLPQASTQLIKKLLMACKDEGLLELTGRGRGARWQLTKKE